MGLRRATEILNILKLNKGKMTQIIGLEEGALPQDFRFREEVWESGTRFYEIDPLLLLTPHCGNV